MAEKTHTKKNREILDELYRRVEITYRTRINSAKRLRNKDENYKKLNIYYSALVTAFSILTLNVDMEIIKGLKFSTITLTCSIILTYFMLYISEQNLQERAYRMEETYKKLDILKNKILILLTEEQRDVTERKCEKIYKEYETIIASIENHELIDYQKYKLAKFEKKNLKEMQDEELRKYNELRKKIMIHDQMEKIKLIMMYCLPFFFAFSLFITGIKTAM